MANAASVEIDEPTWKWDCGFKLNYDGPIVSFSSRFYPPKTDYGPKWDGAVTVLIAGETMQEKSFECDSLEELRSQVEAFKADVVNRLKTVFDCSPKRDEAAKIATELLSHAAFIHLQDRGGWPVDLDLPPLLARAAALLLRFPGL